MKILLRAAKDPFEAVSPETTLAASPNGLFGKNVGNLVFADAVHRLLSIPGTQVVPDRFGADRTTDPSRYAARANEQFDVFVVPLANAFRHSFERNLRNLTAVISRLKIPVVVIGTGIAGGPRSLDDPFPAVRGELRESVVHFVRSVLDRSDSVGVRGEFTREFLADLGFGDDHVDAVGCPSLYGHGPDLTVVKRVEQLNADSAIAMNVTPYVRTMGKIATDHAARYHDLVYIPQDVETLRLMLWGTPVEKVPATAMPLHDAHPLYREDRMRFFVDSSTWIRYLADRDFSFGTRIHGNIAALAGGTPAHVIAHDSRTLELARFHEIPHTRVPDLPRSVDAADLYQRSAFDDFNRGHRGRFERFSAFLARNGLAHVYEPGNANPGYDESLSAAELPPAVRVFASTDPDAARATRERVAALYALDGRSRWIAAHPLPDNSEGVPAAQDEPRFSTRIRRMARTVRDGSTGALRR